MNSRSFRKFLPFSLILFLGFAGIQCATFKGEVDTQEERVPVKTYPPDYVHPLTEVNLQKVFEENRGLKVLEENATTVRDYYRGGVQEKEVGEKLLEEGNWEEAQAHFKKSNQYLKVVANYLPEDEAYRNVYGDHVIIFLPNLLMADNQLKLARVYRQIKGERGFWTYWLIRQGRGFLSQSLRSVKTEWAFQVEKEFEKELARK